MLWLYNILGLPLSVALTLILCGIIWYAFGSRAASVIAAIGVVFITMRLNRENAVLRERQKNNEADREAISEANRARLNSRSNSNAGGLHDDDGFKRP